MKEIIKILILEHDPNDIGLLQYELKKSDLEFVSHVAATRDDLKNALLDFRPGIILSDFSFPSFNAIDAFKIKQEMCPDIPFIIISGTLGEEKAVELIKSGVTDYALKDKLFTVVPKIKRALKEFNDQQEKQLAAVKLKEYSEEITDILESIGDGFFAVDENWVVTYWNNAAERMIGIQREDILKKNIWDTFPEAYSLKFYPEYHRAVKEKVSVRFEEYMPSFNAWFGVSAYPTSKGLSIYFKNITERIQQEEKLRVAMERYEIISKASNDAIWDLNINERRVFRSYGIQQIFGYSDEKIYEDPEWWATNLHPEDRQRVVSKIETHLSKNKTHWEDEYRFRCANGTYKFVYDRGYIMIDENNNPYRMIGAMMDLTTLKQLENRLIQERVTHQKMLSKATIEGQEKEKSEIGRELHDNINQILATVKLYIESVISTLGPDNELLNKSAQNLQMCINEIRKLSKSLVAPAIKELGLVDSLEELIETVSLTKLFSIDFKHEEYCVNNLGIQKQLALYRIIQEQMNNIIKHAKASRVIIELSADENEVLLNISDNGQGFDPAAKRHGIGLGNIQNRAELLNGSMEIISAPGAGCTIVVHFPIGNADPDSGG